MFQRFFKLDKDNRVRSIREGHYELNDKDTDEILIPSATNKNYQTYMYSILVDEQLVDDETTISYRNRDADLLNQNMLLPQPSEQ